MYLTGYTCAMDAWQAQKYTWGLVIGILICSVAAGIFYSRHRYAIATAMEAGTWASGFPAQRVNIPATKCVLSRAGFDESYTAHAYFDGRSSRIDSVVHGDGKVYTVHTVTTDGVTAHIWQDGENTVEKVSVTELGTPLKGVVFQDIQCEPVWFPDDTLFRIPNRI